MSKQLQFRGGTTAEHSAFTGASREVTVDTDKRTLILHDGMTAGGIPLTKQSDTDLKAPLDSPALTGTPTAPTAIAGTNTTQVATTEFVNAEIANDTYSKTQLDAGQLDNRYYTETEVDDSLALKANLSGATFTGQVKGITPVSADDLTRKDYIDTAVATKQVVLVSGTNIKTVNGASILGSGDLSAGDVVDTASVLNATAGATLGAVGSYAMLVRRSLNTNIVNGSTYAGSGLAYSGFAIWNKTTYEKAYGMGWGSVPAGTWRAMGATNGINSSLMPATLFLRIS